LNRAAAVSAAHRHVVSLLLATLIALAWIVLWSWGQSPYGRYLHHGGLGALNVDSALCRAFAPGPFRELLLPFTLTILGWVVMVVAMMVPSSLPLILVFQRVSEARRDRALLLGVLLIGYLVAWVLFGLTVYLVDWLMFRQLLASDWIIQNSWLIAAASLFAAGLFQFSTLKYRCLDKCRSPITFVMQHWRGRAHVRYAFLLGVRHGAFCVSCCWALMLLMFTIGAGSLGWMLILGTFMVMEKNLAWGAKIGRPLGLALIAWSTAIVIANVSAPNA
jgi:predicted metal-binding membrane protein